MSTTEEQIIKAKSLLSSPQIIMISPMEMNYNDGYEYLKKYLSDVYCVQLDGSDKPLLSRRWKPMYEWAEILYNIDKNKLYYLHLFSYNLDWMIKELHKCVKKNPNLKGFFIQVDNPTIDKINIAIENVKILQEYFIDKNILGGLSLNASDLNPLYNSEQIYIDIAEKTYNLVNQITLPNKNKNNYTDITWITKTALLLSKVLEKMNSRSNNKWGIDRGVDKLILEELFKYDEICHPGMATLGKGLIYF